MCVRNYSGLWSADSGGVVFTLCRGPQSQNGEDRHQTRTTAGPSSQATPAVLKYSRGNCLSSTANTELKPVMLSSMLMLVTVAAAVADTDYCGITTCSGSSHTMCLYSTAGAASGCPTVLERGVSAADQTEILAAHNTIRRDVKSGLYAADNLPAAESMADLTWDDELAEVAQRWADQCTGVAHDQCRDVSRFRVGQNVARKWNSPSLSKNWTTDAVHPWFHGELPDFKQQNLTFVRTDLAKIGHLTQVIWADTTKVGCGYIAVTESIYIDSIKDYYSFARRNYICNYGPAGNFLGQEIYEPAA